MNVIETRERDYQRRFREHDNELSLSYDSVLIALKNTTIQYFRAQTNYNKLREYNQSIYFKSITVVPAELKCTNPDRTFTKFNFNIDVDNEGNDLPGLTRNKRAMNLLRRMKCHREFRKGEPIGQLTEFLAKLQILVSDIARNSGLKGLPCDNYSVWCGTHYNSDNFLYCFRKSDMDLKTNDQQIANLAYSLGFGLNNRLVKKDPLPSIFIVLHMESLMISLAGKNNYSNLAYFDANDIVEEGDTTEGEEQRRIAIQEDVFDDDNDEEKEEDYEEDKENRGGRNILNKLQPLSMRKRRRPSSTITDGTPTDRSYNNYYSHGMS